MLSPNMLFHFQWNVGVEELGIDALEILRWNQKSDHFQKENHLTKELVGPRQFQTLEAPVKV